MTTNNNNSSNIGTKCQSNTQDPSTSTFSVEEFRQSINKFPLSIIIVGGSGHLTRSQVLPNLFTLYTRNLLPENFTLVAYARTKKTDDEFRNDVQKAIESEVITDLSAVTGDKQSKHQRKGNWLHNAKAFLTRKRSTSSSATTHTENTERIHDPQSSEFTKKNDNESKSDHELVSTFVSRCYYRSGQYNNETDFQDLHTFLKEKEDEARISLQSKHEINNEQEQEQLSSPSPPGIAANRLWHLAIPPSEFGNALKCIHTLPTPPPECFQRIAIEKPFGEDAQRAEKLNHLIETTFDEKDIFRIDHFLEKEWVQQLLVLRFANPIFANVWSNENIAYVVVNITETKSVEGRGQYFDQMGILGDMIQNHLLQILSIIALDEPYEFHNSELHAKKTELLNSIIPLKREDVVLGQYIGDKNHPGYKEEESVPNNSKAETLASCVVYIDNDTWKGVPFLLHSGKGLNKTTSELKIVFKAPKNFAIYAGAAQNEMCVDLSEKPHVRFTVNQKRVGVSWDTQLLTLTADKDHEVIPMKAYERVFLDLLHGDHQVFVSKEEAVATWKVVDHLMKTIHTGTASPLPYKFGSTGPAEIDQLLHKHNIPLTRDDL